MAINDRLRIFLINLDSSKERLNSATKQLRIAGLEFQRVPAIDGRDRDPRSFPEYDEVKAVSWFGRKLSGGELGCYYSHVDCIRRFLNSDAEYGLVLEDDVLIGNNSPQLIRRLMRWLDEKNSQEWHMVNLGGLLKYPYSPLEIFNLNTVSFQICQAHYFPYTTTAILWSRTGAESFLKTTHHIFAPIDVFLRYWNTDHDAGLAFTEPPFATTEVQSDIALANEEQNLSDSSLYFLKRHILVWRNKFCALRNKIKFGGLD